MEKKMQKDNFELGLKIHLDDKLNIINSGFFLKIINELTSIQNCFVTNNFFEAGYQLGRLQRDLVILMEQFEQKEKNGQANK